MAHRRSQGVRLEEVAHAAGVHVSTVSRVLNGTRNVSISADTRDRVIAAAQQLRYRPNAIARGLKLATTGSVGLLVPSLRNPVYSAITRGAFQRAWDRDFIVLLAEDSDDSSTAAAYERLVDEGRIDGLLIASARPGSPFIQRFVDGRVPCVFVNRRVPGTGANVAMREEDAGALAARHLVELGHARLAHIAGPLELDTARRRADGFLDASRAAGHEPVVIEAGFHEHGGYTAIQTLLEGDGPTGVFVSNLNQAIGAMAGAREAGRTVPADVSVVSYDDDPYVEYLEVPLTTIRMPLFELGVAGVDALLDRVEGRGDGDVVVPVAPELVVRRSTAPPP